MPISWLNHKPHAIAVYASWPALPSAHATLATGRPATALPGPVLHRLDCTSFCWRLRKVGLAVSAVEASRKRFSAFLVPRDTPGLVLVPGPVVDFLRPSPHCGLTLERCVVPAEALIGTEGGAFEAMSIPFRAVEDAAAGGTIAGAVRHLVAAAGKAALPLQGAERDAAAAELGALAGLAAALGDVALALAAALDGAAQDARLIGFRQLLQVAAERLLALSQRLGCAWSPAAAALLRDIGKSLDIAKGPRLARQTRLGLSLLDHGTS